MNHPADQPQASNITETESDQQQQQDMAEHISCPLCGDFLTDAVTLTGCLHFFCRPCLLRHLSSSAASSAQCPKCFVKLGPEKPFYRPDRALQELVYKLVPDLLWRRLRRIARHRHKHSHKQHSTSSAPDTDRLLQLSAGVCAPGERVSLRLDYVPLGDVLAANRPAAANLPAAPDPASRFLFTRFFRCPARCRVAHLKRLLELKLAVLATDPQHPQGVYFVEPALRNVVEDEYTMEDLIQLFGWDRTSGPLPLRFTLARMAQDAEEEEEDKPPVLEEMPQLELEGDGGGEGMIGMKRMGMIGMPDEEGSGRTEGGGGMNVTVTTTTTRMPATQAKKRKKPAPSSETPVIPPQAPPMGVPIPCSSSSQSPIVPMVGPTPAQQPEATIATSAPANDQNVAEQLAAPKTGEQMGGSGPAKKRKTATKKKKAEDPGKNGTEAEEKRPDDGGKKMPEMDEKRDESKSEERKPDSGQAGPSPRTDGIAQDAEAPKKMLVTDGPTDGGQMLPEPQTATEVAGQHPQRPAAKKSANKRPAQPKVSQKPGEAPQGQQPQQPQKAKTIAATTKKQRPPPEAQPQQHAASQMPPAPASGGMFPPGAAASLMAAAQAATAYGPFLHGMHNIFPGMTPEMLAAALANAMFQQQQQQQLGQMLANGAAMANGAGMGNGTVNGRKTATTTTTNQAKTAPAATNGKKLGGNASPTKATPTPRGDRPSMVGQPPGASPPAPATARPAASRTSGGGSVAQQQKKSPPNGHNQSPPMASVFNGNKDAGQGSRIAPAAPLKAATMSG